MKAHLWTSSLDSDYRREVSEACIFVLMYHKNDRGKIPFDPFVIKIQI